MTAVSKTGRLLSVAIHLIAISVVFFIPTVQAATFCVSDATGLHDALTQAAGNGEDDIIRVQQGTYVGNFVYSSHEANSLTLKGGYTAGCASRTIDPTNTILDGNEAGNVLAISTDKASPARIEGLGLQNGVAFNDYGGGVYFKTVGGNLEIVKCGLSGNSASYRGGGVYADVYCTGTVDLILANNTFAGNSVHGDGGAIHAYIHHGNANLKLTLSDNIFTENSASYGNGGGVSADARSGFLNLTLTNNTFTENSASYSGGGVYADVGSGTISLAHNTFTGNTASNNGGGVYAKSHAGTVNLTLTDNTFTGNSASYSGGGGVSAKAYLGTTDLTLTNNTFYANQGAISTRLDGTHSIARICNNILWMNTISGGVDIYIDNDGDNDFLPSPVELFNNDFDQSAAGCWIKIPFPIDPSNLDKADPLFVNAANRDLHLSAGSPCTDAGDNDVPGLPSTDKD